MSYLADDYEAIRRRMIELQDAPKQPDTKPDDLDT